MGKIKQYIWNLLILLDCAIDSIFFFSSPFETMSSRCWRYRDTWQGRYAVKFVDWLAWIFFKEKDHCQKSEQSREFYINYEILK